MSCPVCEVIQKGLMKKVYEDANIVAILDETPATKGHVVVLPKIHAAIFEELPAEIVQHMFIMIKKLANAVCKTLQTTDYNIIISNGVSAGQTSTHFLVNILPRIDGDGLSFTWEKQRPENLEKLQQLMIELQQQPNDQSQSQPTITEDDYLTQKLDRLP